MSKLKELVNSIKAFTVVIIENDFTYLDDPYKIVARFCFSSNEKQKKLLKDLEENEFKEISENLQEFEEAFLSKDHDMELIKALPAEDNFEFYLKKMNFEDLLQNNIFNTLKEIVKEDEDLNQFKDVILKHGYFSGYPNAHYDDILSELDKIGSCEIKFYKNIPPADKEDKFIEDIKTSIAETSSNFYLAIIDKSLESGGDDEAGKTFVTDLIQLNEKSQLNFICCIYTSRSNQNGNSPETFKEYFVQEVEKNKQNVVENIGRILAHSAYASVFNSIKVNSIRSSEKTLEIVLKNQKNIKYIIDESHKEGIPPYDAIKYWFNLSLQKNFDDHEITDFGFTSGLVSFFKNEYLEDHPQLSEISDELQKLNTFELFDNNINKKFSPIAPGDIWECKGEYYILVGQLCDLLIRRDKKSRNAKIGELLKLTLCTNNTDKKFDIEEKSTKKIKISNFKDQSDQYRTLEVEISTPNIYFADLEVLDLAMFNLEGDCIINLNNQLCELTKNILPSYAESYYQELKKFYSNSGILQLSLLSNNLEITGPLDFSKMKFVRNDLEINHEIKRISRLKGRYYDSLYNNYLNNKGRIDLNLIDNSPETASSCKLVFQFSDDTTTLKTVENFTLWNSKGKKYIKLADLKIEFPNFANIFSFSNDENMTFENNKQYVLSQNEDVLSLTYKYRLDDNKYHSKGTFSYNDLFNEAKPNKNNNFRIIGSEDDISFTDASGRATRLVTLDELKIGIIVFEKEVVLSLVDGVLIRKKYEG